MSCLLFLWQVIMKRGVFLKKRILSVCLCLVLITGCVLSDFGTIKIKAASAPTVPAVIDSELYYEILLSIYTVLETGMIASGSREITYIKGATDLSEVFFKFMDTLSDSVIGDPCFPDITFETETGQTISLDEGDYKFVLDDGRIIDIDYEQFQQALWSGTITLDPETETQEDIVVGKSGDLKRYLQTKIDMANKYGQGGENWPDGGSDNDPEDGISLFTKIKNVTIGAGTLTAVGTFINNLVKGETTLDSSRYFDLDDITYVGDFPYRTYKTASGATTFSHNYKCNVYKSTDDYRYHLLDISGSSGYLYFVVGYYSTYKSSVYFNVASVNTLYSSFDLINKKNYALYSSEGDFVKSQTINGINAAEISAIECNFPCFASQEAAREYTEGLYNNYKACPENFYYSPSSKSKYNYADLATSVPVTLAPLIGKTIAANDIIKVNRNLSAAADSIVEPDIDTDSMTNNNTYKQIITDTATKVANQVNAETDNNPDTSTETKPDTGTDTGTETKPDTGTDTSTETKPNTGTDTGTETKPDTGTDTGTETKPDTDTDTGTETKPDTGTDTGTETKPDIDTGDGTDTDPGEEMDAEGYKVDLTMIFPFCLPFDLIAFFDALSAEPVTPVFEFPFVVPALDYNENVTIDLSIFDGVMEIFRLGELGCFIIMLIYATSKLIKW